MPRIVCLALAALLAGIITFGGLSYFALQDQFAGVWVMAGIVALLGLILYATMQQKNLLILWIVCLVLGAIFVFATNMAPMIPGLLWLGGVAAFAAWVVGFVPVRKLASGGL